MDALQSVQHHKKVEHLFLLCQVLAEKKPFAHLVSRPYVFLAEPRMVLAEGRLLFSCLGVVGDIRYSNDLGLMKRHGKRLYFYKGSRELVCKNIAAILKTNHIG